MEETGAADQQAVLADLSFFKTVEGKIKEEQGKCLTDDTVMHEKQSCRKHIEANQCNVLRMFVYQPEFSDGDDKT